MSLACKECKQGRGFDHLLMTSSDGKPFDLTKPVDAYGGDYTHFSCVIGKKIAVPNLSRRKKIKAYQILVQQDQVDDSIWDSNPRPLNKQAAIWIVE